MVWEHFIGYGLSFFVNLAKGVYSSETVVYLVLLGLFALCAEGIILFVRRTKEHRMRTWLKGGITSVVASIVVVGVLALVYRSIFLRFPELVGILSEQVDFTAKLSMATVAIGWLGIIVVEWIKHIRVRAREST